MSKRRNGSLNCGFYRVVDIDLEKNFVSKKLKLFHDKYFLDNIIPIEFNTTFESLFQVFKM